jgi:DNA-binding response OmpR family regulator
MTIHKILVVDHEPKFVALCQQWLEPEGFVVEPAASGAEALPLLQSEIFDLAVVALALPDTDSLEIVRALSTENTPVIVTSQEEMVPLNRVAAALQLGAASLVEKPGQPAELLDIVQQVLTHYASDAVRGSLRDLSLTSLVTINCNEGRTATLEIRHNHDRAVIFFEKGQIVHALFNDQAGEAAIFEALTWDDGHFILTTGQPAPQQTIHTSWSGLLLEGLRRIDEAGFDQEYLPLESGPEPKQWAPAFEEPLPAPPPRPASFDLDADTQTQIEEQLSHLYRELGARSVLFANRSGRLLHQEGQMEQGRALSLAALVAGSFSATTEIADMLARPEDEARQFRQSLQEGADFSLYSTEVDPAWVLAVAFEPDITNLGLARQLTLQTAADLESILAQAQATAGQQQEVTHQMNEAFRAEVSDALGALFD